MSDYIPKPGDIGVTSVSGLAGQLIRFGQWLNGDGYANYEHAFVYVGAGIIVEAEPGGARLARLSEYNGRRVVWITAPDDKGPLISKYVRQFLGTPYSVADYLAIAAQRFHLFPLSRLLRKRVESTGYLICSQLADLAYEMAGVHLFNDGRIPGDVTPADLARIADVR